MISRGLAGPGKRASAPAESSRLAMHWTAAGRGSSGHHGIRDADSGDPPCADATLEREPLKRGPDRLPEEAERGAGGLRVVVRDQRVVQE